MLLQTGSSVNDHEYRFDRDSENHEMRGIHGGRFAALRFKYKQKLRRYVVSVTDGGSSCYQSSDHAVHLTKLGEYK